MRVGIGYDIHRFAPGRALVLGGVRIEHDRGLTGHSDADALLHAITDAVLGALAAGDIGQLFPDSDPKWANADSSMFLTEAVSLARRQGLHVVNCDTTVITESPKLAEHVPAMRRRIAELLDIEPAGVSVKAKTNEGLGPVGAGRALAAMAVVVLDES